MPQPLADDVIALRVAGLFGEMTAPCLSQLATSEQKWNPDEMADSPGLRSAITLDTAMTPSSP